MDDPLFRHHDPDIPPLMEPEQGPQSELQPCPEPDTNGRRRQPPVWFLLPVLCICLFQVAVLVPQIAHLNIGPGRFFGIADHQDNTHAARLNRAVSGTPRYPQDMIDRHIEDHVTVACRIDAQGRSHDCMVREGHYAELNQAARDYVVQASYFPAMRNGHPVSSHYRMHFNFLIPPDR
ncbi:MAG: energy transducer TonB [Gluconobacter potus]|uniref:Energy transducer TonB n=1 Tax=Gluconobacter potus TaxID=2724927 RepID=A0ABR9YMG9_9PROT|nr:MULTISPECIES: energy transducer TonB [Gluconobacter]MBF0864877.1 energy transducer TonB [Gluconobacter sp. R71656]MBF0868032.1 energy transducer TonB [Gluconobacter sp. R75628]MBF0874014.1 energy transducer TonB [Gluconobacter sp. R75629]MBF0882991.1 energy transducer TonB [Gluconobacter potus]